MNIQPYTPRPESAWLLKESSGPVGGEDLFQLGDIGPVELIKGELVFMTPTGYPHGIDDVIKCSFLNYKDMCKKDGTDGISKAFIHRTHILVVHSPEINLLPL